MSRTPPRLPRHRGSVRRSLAVVAVLLVGGALLAQTAPAHDRGRYVLTLREELLPQRLALLHEIRIAVRPGGDRARIAAVVRDLAADCQRGQAGVCAWIEQQGGTVVAQWWIIPALCAELPADVAARLDARAEITAATAEREWPAHIKVSTNARNHNADYVQNTLLHWGAGTALALLDSGIDISTNGSGTVHPAFQRRSPPGGSRILQSATCNQQAADDPDGHGTAVAAIAAGVDWQAVFGGSDHGFAPDADIASYKITGPSGTASDAAIIQAWQDVLADLACYNISVANMSFGGSPSPTYPTQQALDTAAYFGDILVVTSAGNGGMSPIPGASSQANVNGLAVGAVFPDTGSGGTPHQVWPCSTFGPLPGDAARFFPDLVACGVGVVSALRDSPLGRSINTGTSFAAPAVAGTGAVLRAVAPSLSAVDTKAILLNHAEDVSAQNPGKTRFHYGLGLLRADLATDALTKSTLLHGTLAPGGPTQQTFSVAVQSGVHYAATVAWPRIAPANPWWDDLDLRVLDANGKTVAMSASLRNVYERALFRATTTGSYSLVVTAKTFTSASVGFSLSFGENFGGGVQMGSYLPYGVGCAGTAPDPSRGLILPRVAANATGNASTRVPFSYYPTRLQQLYPGSEVTQPTLVTQLAFRRDEQQADSPGYDLTLELLLGYSAQTPTSLRTDFANYVNGSAVTVLAPKTIRFAGTQGLPAGARQFDFAIQLDQPFQLAPAVGHNVLLEARVSAHTQGNVPFPLYFDAVQDSAVGRVYGQGYPNTSNVLVDDFALVTSFLGQGGIGITPNLQADGRPQLGQSFRVVLRHALPGTAVALVHGQSRSQWWSLPLPYELSLVGAPGCLLLSDLVVSVPLVADPLGVIEIAYAIPNDPALAGETFYNQFWVADPNANALGIVFSNAGEALVGG